MAKRTLSRKDGTVWTEAEMQSRKSFERLRLQLQGSTLSLAPEFNVPMVPTPAPNPGKMAPAPLSPTPAPDIWILVIVARLRC